MKPPIPDPLAPLRPSKGWRKVWRDGGPRLFWYAFIAVLLFWTVLLWVGIYASLR